MNNLDFWESNGPFHVWGLLDPDHRGDEGNHRSRHDPAASRLADRLNLEAQDVISHPDQSWFDVAAAAGRFQDR